MAFTEFYCNASTGSNVNAGDLTANGIVTSTNGGWSTVTNIFTAASGTPFSGVSVGDFASVYVDGATTAVYIGRVTTVGGGGATLTISSSAKSGTAPTTSGTGRSCTTGGAWKGPNAAEGFPFGFVASTLTNVSSNAPRVNLKNNATYTITAAITHANTGFIVFQGYTTTAGDGGKATIDGGTSGVSYTLLTKSVNQVDLVDLIFQNNGATGSADGLALSGGRSVCLRVVVNSVRGSGFTLSSVSQALVECEAYACNQSNTSGSAGFNLGTTSGSAISCIAHDNVGNANVGFISSSNIGVLVNCIADTNGTFGFSFTGQCSLVNCVAYNNGASGVRVGSSLSLYIQNCIFVNNGTYGVDGADTSNIARLTNCAFYNNTSGPTNSILSSLVTGSITLSGDPFNAAATGDFRLNNTAGTGASCRQAGRGAFTETQASYTGTVAYPDVGAVETQVVYPTAAQVQLGVTFDVLAAVTGTYNPGGGGGAILSRAFLGMGAGV